MAPAATEFWQLEQQDRRVREVCLFYDRYRHLYITVSTKPRRGIVTVVVSHWPE
jgi:hypothetical protein